VFSIYLNLPQIKIIITSFRTTRNPFRHDVCQTTKAQKLFKHQICSRNNQGHADGSGDFGGNYFA